MLVWMTFGQEYLTHLHYITKISIYGTLLMNWNITDKKMVPIQFLKAVLPNPGDLGENYRDGLLLGVI